jgi:uncharacterized membrane protein
MDNQQQHSRQGGELAVGLACFSIGLGLTELFAPERLARLIGAPEGEATTATLRGLGAREIAHGVAILARPDAPASVWARVGGDLIDLSFLAAALNAPDTRRGRMAAATASVLGLTALDLLCAQQLGRSTSGRAAERGSRAVHVNRVITVNRPIEDVYRFWRDVTRFPRFMRHLESVEMVSERRSRWRAKGPAGTTVEWDADLVEDREPDIIAWRSVEGSEVQNSGVVRFGRAPGARGTEVRVELEYSPPAGSLGRAVAWLFGDAPEQHIHEDLHRFKQLVETGEIALSDGPSLRRAARPAGDPGHIRTLAGVER